MNTKQYLGQLERIERKVEYKQQEIERLRALSTKISSTQGDGMNIQRTRNMDKMGTAVAKIVDLEKIIIRYEETYVQIMSQIEDIDVDKYQDIIVLRYVDKKSILEIASELNYSLSHTKKLHRDALNYFESKYGDSYL